MPVLYIKINIAGLKSQSEQTALDVRACKKDASRTETSPDVQYVIR